MKIAVAATEKDASSQIAYDGGRAPVYLIFDPQGTLLEAFANPYSTVDRHAGFEVSRMLAEEGVEVVIAQLFGPMMIQELSAHGIRCVIKSGQARAAIDDLTF